MAATPRDLLLAEMAVQTGFVPRTEVDACLAALDGAAEGRTLLDELSARGHLAPGQVQLLDSLADKEPEHVPGRDEEGDDADFQRLVDIKRLAAAGEVEKVMELLRGMGSSSRFERLGRILLRKSMLNADQIHSLLAEKGIRLLRCASCEKNFEIRNYDESKTYRCGACRQPLQPMDPQDIPIPDAGGDEVVSES